MVFPHIPQVRTVTPLFLLSYIQYLLYSTLLGYDILISSPLNSFAPSYLGRLGTVGTASFFRPEPESEPESESVYQRRVK